MIFYPVWIDQSAPEASQTMWISIYFLCEQFGIVAGQGSSTLMISTLGKWQWSFLVETALMVGPVLLLYLFVPARYFESAATAGDEEVAEAKQTPVRPQVMSAISY